MDTDICGLNKLVVSATAGNVGTIRVRTYDRSMSWEKPSGQNVEFLIPSIPAPAKQKYIVEQIQNGLIIADEYVTLGFGDHKLVSLGATSVVGNTIISKEDNITVRKTIQGSQNAVIIGHGNPGDKYKTYGERTGYFMKVPFPEVDNTGHIRECTSYKIPTTGYMVLQLKLKSSLQINSGSTANLPITSAKFDGLSTTSDNGLESTVSDIVKIPCHLIDLDMKISAVYSETIKLALRCNYSVTLGQTDVQRISYPQVEIYNPSDTRITLPSGCVFWAKVFYIIL